MESIIVPIHKKGDKTDCNNYRGISLLPTTYKILSNILLSRLIPYAEEVIGDHQCGFRRDRSTTDHIFCIRQILEKKWEYNEAVHQLFIDFKKGYQPRTCIVKDEKGDLVADSHSIMTRWRKYFSQLLNVHGAKEVRQAEIHTAEPLMPEPSDSEVELAIEKLKSHKSPGVDQIPAELIKAGGRTIRCAIHKLILFGLRRNCRTNGRSRS